ncbi:LexA family protein [Metabacillus niabensis]|uniref:Repressor LexA n=1 Tax=Metabacillus niabensis TaxID=324854 RepID=A0ABT9Z9Y0_9BACI|nr:helix-turn-helix domain-containing protein [Metabacillus niabensis]MDQ0228739.1 repressor LexA [Metabacillus niabensis]
MHKGITKRQKEVLEIINEHVDEKGYPPSYREIAYRMNICSSSTIQSHLDKLKEKGYVTWVPGQPRTLKVINEKTAS